MHSESIFVIRARRPKTKHHTNQYVLQLELLRYTTNLERIEMIDLLTLRDFSAYLSLCLTGIQTK